MLIALAQINSTLGDFEENRRKILDFARRALERRCELVIFPEHALFGYLPNDLLEREEVVRSQIRELRELEKKMPKGIAALVGCVTEYTLKLKRPIDSLSQKKYRNSAALIERGTKTRYFHKERLPTYDVFDEARHLVPGSAKDSIVRFRGKKFLVTICEDIWGWGDPSNPLLRVPRKGIDAVINLSASPFTVTKKKKRLSAIRETAKRFSAPVVYVNMVGAQDEVLFDGRSTVVTAKGKQVSELAAFDEDIGVFDLARTHMAGREEASDEELLRKALVTGIRDFAHKTGLQKVHFGLSGGIDSAVVACLAVDALGPAAVTVLTLPSQFNDPNSKIWADRLSKNLGVRSVNIPIESSYAALLDAFEGSLGKREFSLVNENLQARVRGTLMMAYSNREGSLLLSTANKSELAAGYSTLYGDQCGGLMPLGDLLKAQVYGLARYYNSEYELIPNEIIERPPSAELRPGQRDQDSLPPYDALDADVVTLIDKRGRAKTKTQKWLLSAAYKSEFKRWQAPPILKVSDHAFGRGRRMPIAHRAKD